MPPSDAPAALLRDGVAVFEATAETARWAEAALGAARPLIASEAARRAWLRCEGTWFAGVDLLPNAADVSVDGVPLEGPALAAVEALGLTPPAWHAAQVSVAYPGYPRPMEGESAGAGRYRMRRDAAHVDGLLPFGSERRRRLAEPHAFILGIPLTDSDAHAAPLVVWPGSHRPLGRAFAAARAAAGGTAADEVDLTDAYVKARRHVFEACARRTVPLRPGAAVLLHRHLLHGIAPWDAPDAPEGRAVAYFRPLMPDPEAWFRQDGGDEAAGGRPGPG